MKTSLAAVVLLATLLFSAVPARAGGPSKGEADLHARIASFISRVAYAKAHADPQILDKGGGTLSCIVYIVKQGPNGAPGYAVVIATDKSFAPMDDLAAVCDTAEIDPAHSIKCSGHVVFVQGGWINVGGDGMTLQLGLGKKDRVLKITGPRKSDPM
ncbi:MAG TPA: hypothetical protein VG733_02510 [Chthoniobacteraceae bacterium]|nr:hypothetical protein [Chthoniobacteraceae bacterium]